MSTYILHFNTPLAHARHYVGCSAHIRHRINQHNKGNGSRITQVCVERGIEFVLARVFKGKDRKFERKLKRTHSVRDYCPLCMGDRVREYRPKPEKEE